MHQPPFRFAQLPALINYICKYWNRGYTHAPINFKGQP